MRFVPCNGQCTKEDTHCESCGRSHEAIAEMKQLATNAVAFATKMEYENTEEYTKAFSNTMNYLFEFNQ